MKSTLSPGQYDSFMFEQQCKKILCRRRVLLGIPIFILACTVLTNFTQLGNAHIRAGNMQAEAAAASSRLEEARQVYEDTLNEISKQRAVLNSCQSELEALPTPRPDQMMRFYRSDVTYEQLQRNPEMYIGEKIALMGEVNFESVNLWNGSGLDASANLDRSFQLPDWG